MADSLVKYWRSMMSQAICHGTTDAITEAPPEHDTWSSATAAVGRATTSEQLLTRSSLKATNACSFK